MSATETKQPSLSCRAIITTESTFPSSSRDVQLDLLQYCKKQNITFISAHPSTFGAADAELGDISNFSKILGLDIKDPTFISDCRAHIRQTMSQTLLYAASAMGGTRKIYGQNLSKEVQASFSAMTDQWQSVDWTSAACGLDESVKWLHPLSDCTPDKGKRAARIIANACNCPLNGPLDSFCLATLDEFELFPENGTFFLPVDVDSKKRKLTVNLSSSCWVLAHQSLVSLSAHWTEVLRWQSNRPTAIPGSSVASSDGSSRDESIIVDEQLAAEWAIFERTLTRPLLISTLRAILDMEDVAEQGEWLPVVRGFEHAASHLTWGRMTEICDEILERSRPKKETSQ